MFWMIIIIYILIYFFRNIVHNFHNGVFLGNLYTVIMLFFSQRNRSVKHHNGTVSFFVGVNLFTTFTTIKTLIDLY